MITKYRKSVKYIGNLECLWVKILYLSLIELWRYILHKAAVCCRISILFAWPSIQNIAATCNKYFKLSSSVLLSLTAS